MLSSRIAARDPGRHFDAIRVTIIPILQADDDGGMMTTDDDGRLRWEGTYVTYGGGARPGEPRCNVGLQTHIAVTEAGPWTVTVTDFAHPDTPHRIKGVAAPPAMIDAGGLVIVIIPPSGIRSVEPAESPDPPSA